MDHEHAFGAWLRRTRLDADLTQEALAEAVGCAAETLRAFESGRRRPSREMALRIAAALHIPAEEHAAFLRRARLREAPAAPTPTLDSGPSHASAPTLPYSAPHPPRDALIGRADLLRRVQNALLDDQHALVTLLGPGGIGKTRLALHIAADLAGHLRDGAVFVPLASATTVDEALTAIAAALSCPLPDGAQPDTALRAFLRDRALLLVLDNLEQLLVTPQSARLGELLAGIARDAPGVRVLATSRERLRLRAEWVVEVAGLTLPDERHVEASERSEAVLLFLERARQLSDSFALTPANRAAIARICRLLDGVPLAIELAAAWTHVLPCDAIADEVARNLDFLAVEERDRPSRHRSLRAVIEHSWRLLSPAEQTLLARLSVFHGGCRREELVAVVADKGGDASTPTAQLAALRAVAGLVDKSLVRRVLDHQGEARYDLHELVRQYAAEVLRQHADEQRRVHDHHCAVYVGLLQRHEQELWGTGQVAALATLTNEVDNLRAAWQWVVTQYDADRVLAMLDPLWRFYEGRGWFREAATTFAQASAHWETGTDKFTPPEAAAVAHGALLSLRGWFAYRVGRLADARSALERAVALLRPARRSRWLAHALSFLGVAQLYAGEYPAARATCEEGAGLYQSLGHEWGWAYCCGTLGAIAAASGDAAEGMARWRAALDIYRALGDARLQAMSLTFLGAATGAAGDEAEAERQLGEALALSRAIDEPLVTAFALFELGVLNTRRARYGAAEGQLAESLARLRALGERHRLVLVLAQLGKVALAQGDDEAARRHYAESYAAAAVAQSLPGMLGALGGFARLLAERGTPAEALRLAAAILGHPAATAETRAPMERLCARLRPQLGAHNGATDDVQPPADLRHLGDAGESGELPPWLRDLLAAGSARRAARSGAPIQPEQASGPAVEATGETLSPREVEVLRLLMGGLSNRQIAEALVISPHTVKHHVANLFQKLGVTTRTQAVVAGTALGLSPLTARPSP